MKLFPQELTFLKNQQDLIGKIEFLLDQLLASTYDDNRFGRGFGSFYPEKSLHFMQTMNFAIQLEIDSDEKRNNE